MTRHPRQHRLTFRELMVVVVCCFGLLILTLVTVDALSGAIDDRQESARQEAGVSESSQ